MNYIDIFEEIVTIMHNDYSGCIDKKGWDNPQAFREKIEKLDSDVNSNIEEFIEIIQDYLLDFKDGHLHFRYLNNGTVNLYDCGFRCRRYEDRLYITDVFTEERVKKGMYITAIGGLSIEFLSEKHRRELMENKHEREKWDNVLKKYTTCTVVDLDGNSFEMDIKKYIRSPQAHEYSLKKINDNTLFLTLSDFMNTEAINNLIEENKALLENTKNLIIDVRYNRGGSDSSFMLLLNYLFSKRTALDKLDDNKTLFYITERNYKNRVKNLNITETQDPTDRKYCEAFLRELNKYRDSGFVGFTEFDFSDVSDEIIIEGTKTPQNVVVLSDFYCASSGDAFVEITKLADKVTVMGRGTAGITDYSNLAMEQYLERLIFMYPTSKQSNVDEGKGLTGVGVQPDIYIPWTPEHLERDVDLERAIEFLK